jgi:uncharacterized membrane protein YdbT with pleckstrin-like domain
LGVTIFSNLHPQRQSAFTSWVSTIDAPHIIPADSEGSTVMRRLRVYTVILSLFHGKGAARHTMELVWSVKI